MRPRPQEKSSNRKTPKGKRRTTPKTSRAPKRARGTKKPKGARRARRVSQPGRATVAALEREVHRLRLARGRLERRLTAAVQEIGMLRQFEVRAQGLEMELARRDAEMEQLRREHDERVREIEIRLVRASIESTPS